MGRRSAMVWTATAVVAVITAAAVLGRPADVRLSDLSVYLGATADLDAGLYDFIRGNAPFTYPPFAALLLHPLTWFPVPAIQVAWTVATIATVALLAKLVAPTKPTPADPTPAKLTPAQLTPAKLTPAKPTPTQLTPARLTAVKLAGAGLAHARLVAAAKLADPVGQIAPGRAAAVGRVPWWQMGSGLALVLMLSAPVSSDLKYGQVSLYLAALILIDVLILRRTPWAGALIGLAAAIKLTPLILIPLLWLALQRRAAVTAIATFVGCGLLGAMVLPAESWRFWTEAVFQVSRLGYVSNIGNQSLNGALLRLGLEADVRSLLVLTIGGAVAAVALWRATSLARGGEWLGAAIVVGAASVVLSPVSWTHHQIWLVLAVLLPVRMPRFAWTAAVLVLMVLPATALLSEARLCLAIVIAAVVPLATPRQATPEHRGPEQAMPANTTPEQATPGQAAAGW